MALSENECTRNAFRVSPSCPLEAVRKTDASGRFRPQVQFQDCEKHGFSNDIFCAFAFFS